MCLFLNKAPITHMLTHTYIYKHKIIQWNNKSESRTVYITHLEEVSFHFFNIFYK